ncbi:hypothetical protein [Ancylobacter mangrovi]|uniref:Uncharacterized protein n=1 Tax=Ancylobacter mangrovi TaxID=2972472 RepID=A0A9X2T7C6_9HYPH|nr:hypothetical protein [Ancylobacter mangrovi]MCS0495908.1 hypothetical protein [Ancylobacter mangrovi]MCS0504675.1 hypothetical protein [Ancylobacter mangrovi]
MDGIEGRARAICEIGLRGGALINEIDLPAAVDRYWPVFAVEIAAGVINLDARCSLGDLEAALAAYVAWKERPMSVPPLPPVDPLAPSRRRPRPRGRIACGPTLKTP